MTEACHRQGADTGSEIQGGNQLVKEFIFLRRFQEVVSRDRYGQGDGYFKEMPRVQPEIEQLT